MCMILLHLTSQESKSPKYYSCHFWLVKICRCVDMAILTHTRLQQYPNVKDTKHHTRLKGQHLPIITKSYKVRRFRSVNPESEHLWRWMLPKKKTEQFNNWIKEVGYKGLVSGRLSDGGRGSPAIAVKLTTDSKQCEIKFTDIGLTSPNKHDGALTGPNFNKTWNI